MRESHDMILVLVLAAVLVWSSVGMAQSVRLDWNPSENATRYTVYYGRSSQTYDTVLGVGPAISASLSGLTAGATYFFAVTASNSFGDSDYSDEVSYEVPSDADDDTTKPMVILTDPAEGAMVARKTTVTIRATASDNIAVTDVEFRVNGSLTCTDSTSSYTCAWLVPAPKGATYQLNARAYDEAGNSQDSAAVHVTSR